MFTHGAATYGANNWKEQVDLDRYFAALMRHLMKWRKGQITDEDSGHKLKHLAQVAVNAIFLMCHPQIKEREHSDESSTQSTDAKVTIEEFRQCVKGVLGSSPKGEEIIYGKTIWGEPPDKNYPYEHASKDELISDMKWKDNALKKLQEKISELEKKLEMSYTGLSKSLPSQSSF